LLKLNYKRVSSTGAIKQANADILNVTQKLDTADLMKSQKGPLEMINTAFDVHIKTNYPPSYNHYSPRAPVPSLATT
jgi:hypothetical protein